MITIRPLRGVWILILCAIAVYNYDLGAAILVFLCSADITLKKN